MLKVHKLLVGSIIINNAVGTYSTYRPVQLNRDLFSEIAAGPLTTVLQVQDITVELSKLRQFVRHGDETQACVPIFRERIPKTWRT
jgi:hypothetical protein